MISFQKHSRGFTLIELLVVVSIVSLASSIVLAGVTSARVKAVDARTKQDMHQAKLGLAMYASDHGSYPLCDSDNLNFPQTCCLGNTSCVLAGTAVNGKLNVDEIPNYDDNPPTYYDANDNAYQGYVYICAAQDPDSTEPLCDEDDTIIIYSLSTEIIGIDPTGSTADISSYTSTETDIAGNGASCANGQTCAPGLECDGNYRCTLPVGSNEVPLGGWCDHYLQCVPNSFCINFTCSATGYDGYAIGSLCASDPNVCDSNLICDVSSGQCRAPSGGHCATDNNCQTGYVCSPTNGTCIAQ